MNISKSFRAIRFADFGHVDNPIWHLELDIDFVESRSLQSTLQKFSTDTLLIPVDFLSEENIGVIKSLPRSFRKNIVLQCGINQVGKIEWSQLQDFSLQLWIDRNFSRQDLASLETYGIDTEFIFVPFRNLSVIDLISDHFAALNFRFSILLIPQVNPFSGVADIRDSFAVISELRRFSSQNQVSTVFLNNSFQDYSLALQNFLLWPTSDNFAQFLRAPYKASFMAYRVFQILSPLSWMALFSFLFKSLKNPRTYFAAQAFGFSKRVLSWMHILAIRTYWSGVRSYWLSVRIYWWVVSLCWFVIKTWHRCRDYTLQVLLYPFFKIFWFSKFQFEKRVLRTKR